MKKFIAVLLVFTFNVFSIAKAEEIDNIEITKLTKVELSDSNKELIQSSVGALAGAAIGYGIAHYTTNYGTVGKSLISIGSGMAGAYVANKYGTENTTEGVKIDYMEKSTNKTITIKGNISNFHTGQAILIIDDKGNKSVHQKSSEKVS